MAVAAAIVVAVDQITKSLAMELVDDPVHVVWTLQLNVTLNRGAAFSVGPGFTGAITAVGVVVLAVLLYVARRIEGRAHAVALGLVVGGAAGNLTDRLVRGHDGAVIDFIDLRWWPVFNVADIALFCGAALLVLTSFRD